jgi:hypothetical protein
MKIHTLVKFTLPSSPKKLRIGIIVGKLSDDLYDIKEAAGRKWSAVPRKLIKAISLVESKKLTETLSEDSESV